MGWLRDAWRLPAYIGEANASVSSVETLRLSKRLSPRSPPLSFPTMIAQFLLAPLFSELASTTLDLMQVWPQPRFPTLSSAGGLMQWLFAIQQWPHLLRAASVLLRVLGISIGVWMTGNAHRVQSASFKLVLLATAAAQIAISAQRLFDSRSATASSTDEKNSINMEVQSDFSWFVIFVSVGIYVYFRQW